MLPFQLDLGETNGGSEWCGIRIWRLCHGQNQMDISPSEESPFGGTQSFSGFNLVLVEEKLLFLGLFYTETETT